MDKNTEQDSGRIAEVQALQSEDGTFELVVSDSAAHPVVSEEAARRHREAQTPDVPAAPASAWGLKRAGLVLLLIALVGAGLIVALSGEDEPDADADAPRAARSSNDGFQPYAGGGGGAPGRSSPGETMDRMKAAAAAAAVEEGDRFADPRPEPVPVRSFAPSADEEEPSDENTWELNEAELLEEARAVELAEQAEAEQVDDTAVVEEEEPVAPQGDEAVQPSEQMRRESMKLRNQRIKSPAPIRRMPVDLNRTRQLRPSDARPPLRGLRGLQRSQEAMAPTPIDPGGEGDEGTWNEAEEEGDRVPEFGRD